jgi:hypothetical protein
MFVYKNSKCFNIKTWPMPSLQQRYASLGISLQKEYLYQAFGTGNISWTFMHCNICYHRWK